MKNSNTLYLGFGLLADKDFVQTIFGRQLSRAEGHMRLNGFQLRVLEHDDLPQAIQEDTPPDFRIYGLSDGEPQDRVKVLMLKLSQEELDAIRVLNYKDTLYTAGCHGFDNGTVALVDLLKDQYVGSGEKVEGQNYYPFLNGQEAAFNVARLIHEAYIKPHLEGKPAAKER